MTARTGLRQIDIQRAIRAAKKEGAARVIRRPDGSLSIEIAAGTEISPQSPAPAPAVRKPMVF